ncbi:MAG: hypothetical protein ACOYI5_07030, partial [Christensenellales bacterium]
MDYRTLHEKTVVELRAIAKNAGVKVPANTAKARLVEMLIEAQTSGAQIAPAAQAEGAPTIQR